MTDTAVPIKDFDHPKSSVYLLGAEDYGLMKEAMEHCHHLIKLPGKYSLNAATAGSIILFDRYMKLGEHNGI